MMKAQVISIGDELILGHTVDTNAAWLSGRLTEVGVDIDLHVTVPDRREAIADVMARAVQAFDAVIVTGGLGPTEDDVTRFAVADVMGAELALDDEMCAAIEGFFRERKRQMRAENRVQAMFPVGSTPIPNTCGTAPGIHARIGRADVYCMPGVPREMKVMYEQWIAPRLESDSRRGQRVMRYAAWRCYGTGESDIGARIADLMQRGRNPWVGTSAQEGIIVVRINAWGNTPAQAESLLGETREEVRRRLADVIFGEGGQTLEEVIAAELTKRRMTICTAESCTGGLVAKALTDVSGSSVYFLEGFITYGNNAKIRVLGVPEDLIRAHGAVSAPVAEAMAQGARAAGGADLAVSITGIAGPTGGTPEKPVGLVYIAVADAAGCEVHEHHFGESYPRDVIRDRASKTALNWLRLRLIGPQRFA